MNRKPRLYVAYGSNLNLTQMAFRCPTAKVVGKGEVKGIVVNIISNGYLKVFNEIKNLI